MPWTTPELVEIKMDAEIGAYQPDDFGDRPVDPLAAPAARPVRASGTAAPASAE